MTNNRRFETTTFFDRHFSTILPAVLTFTGILISAVQIYNQRVDLSYDRAQEFSKQNIERLATLIDFIVLYPPSSEKESLQWISLGMEDSEVKRRLKERYLKAIELYDFPLVPIEFSDINIENPDVYSSSPTRETTPEEEADFYRSKLYDIVNSANFSHTITMLSTALSCMQNKKCDKVTMCAFLAPLSNPMINIRVDDAVDRWRTSDQHSGQILLNRLLDNINAVCVVDSTT